MAAIRGVTAEIWDSAPMINVIVRVVDVDGLQGVGESWWGIADRDLPARAGRPMASVVNDVIAPRLIGRDAADMSAIWHDTVDWGQRYGDQGVFLMGVSGVDLALWDLAGRRADEPVVGLMGGAVHETLPAYASLPWLRSEEAVVRETRRALDAGFHAVKLHETDPAFSEAVRREFGPELAVMVDVNGHFDVAAAIEHGRQLADLGVTWFEEPVSPMRDHASIAQVADAVDCPIAAGENEYTLSDFERLVSDAGLAEVQPELTKIGGLTAAGPIARVIESAGLGLSPHNFRLGPSCAASIHWAFSSPAGSWVEIPWFPEGVGFSHPMVLPQLDAGRVTAPDAAGLGA